MPPTTTVDGSAVDSLARRPPTGRFKRQPIASDDATVTPSGGFPWAERQAFEGGRHSPAEIIEELYAGDHGVYAHSGLMLAPQILDGDVDEAAPTEVSPEPEPSRP